jgi:hypothetical protein
MRSSSRSFSAAHRAAGEVHSVDVQAVEQHAQPLDLCRVVVGMRRVAPGLAMARQVRANT